MSLMSCTVYIWDNSVKLVCDMCVMCKLFQVSGQGSYSVCFMVQKCFALRTRYARHENVNVFLKTAG